MILFVQHLWIYLMVLMKYLRNRKKIEDMPAVSKLELWWWSLVKHQDVTCVTFLGDPLPNNRNWSWVSSKIITPPMNRRKPLKCFNTKEISQVYKLKANVRNAAVCVQRDCYCCKMCSTKILILKLTMQNFLDFHAPSLGRWRFHVANQKCSLWNLKEWMCAVDFY